MPGRNDPCPCGSGKKYKKCCLGSEKTFMESRGTPNMATDLLHQLQERVGDSPVSSVEELRRITEGFMEEQKNLGIDDFLGLSSEQMHSILYDHFCSDRDIVSLKGEMQIDAGLLARVPVIKQSLYLLAELGMTDKGVKATQTGNLPRSLVQSFHSCFAGDMKYYRGKPMSQIDVPELDLLVFALKETGVIKIRTGWISLTKKGKELLQGTGYFKLYSTLFHFYGDSLDWLSTTGYGEHVRLVQQALSFNLYILKIKAQKYIREDEISAYFQRAFPQEQGFDRPFVFLFLDRFCLYFGLVDREDPRSAAEWDKIIRYRISRLFSEILDWKI